MSSPLQEPNHLCLTKDEVEDIYAPPGIRRELTGNQRFDKTTRLLGNPLVEGFAEANIVSLEVPGFGPDKSRSMRVDVHRRLAPLFLTAFEKIKAARLPYMLYSLNGYLFRYQLNPDVRAALINRPEYADIRGSGAWNIEFARRDLRNNAFDEVIPYKGGRQKPKKELLSNHAFGSAIDINAATNDYDKKKRFDMPQKIVRIFESLGFYWGGYYHDYMHFEYERSSILGIADESPPQVLYPFSADPQRRESPLKYYFFNEAGAGGYFPLGKQQNLHGGVHLEPDSQAPRVPVNAAMPGYIVAARLMTPGREGNDPFLMEATEGRPLGFVLVRHELSELRDHQPADKVYPLYSLYMHLEAPRWGGAQSDQELEKAPWLAAFLRMQHGAVVNLNPASDDVGRTYWAQEPLNPEAESFKVRDRPQPLPGKLEERTVALTKPSPKHIHEAIEALKKGSIVTFDRPLFPVAAGETLGFLAPGSSLPTPPGTASTSTTTTLPRYLHWELFSLSGAEGAFHFLTQKDDKLKDLLLKVEEDKKDNFLLMPSDEKPENENEISSLLGSTGVDIVRELTHARYGRKLQGFFNDGRKFFSAQDTREQPFTWPLQLTLNNKYKYPGEQGRPCTLEVLYKKQGQPLLKEVLTLSPRGQSTLNVTLNVPAAADGLALWSQDFFTDPVEVSEATLRQKRMDSRTRLFRKAANHRWRNLVLDHINEWTPKGLELQLEARRDAGLFDHLEDTPDTDFERLKKVLMPLCWWARPATREDPFGEVRVLGEGQQSLFGTGEHQLPEDAQLVNMHPVTAAWLVDLLLEKEVITLRKEWPSASLKRDESTREPPYLGLLREAEQLRLGMEVVALLVQHGYGTTQGGDAGSITFWLAPRGESGAGQPRRLSRAPYTEGVAMARLRLPAWGAWEVYATDEGEQRLEPARLQDTTFEVQKPELTGQPFTLGSKPGTLRPLTTGSFVVRDHWPLELAGYVILDYWKAPPRGQPDLTVPPDPGSLAMPAIAARPPAERTAGGLKFKNDDIVGREKDRGNPKVTPNFSFMEFVSHPRLGRVFEGDATRAFRLAVPLAQRLQELRDLCKPTGPRAKDLPLAVMNLQPTGLSLLVGPSSGTPEDLELLVSKLPLLKPSELFTAERVDEEAAVRLTYTPPTTATGPLQFELDLAPALGRLAAQALSQPGETLHIRPRFLAPNGGHTLHTTGRLTPMEGLTDVFAASAEQLQAACGNDFLEVVADRCLPPVARFAFGELEVKMGTNRLRTEVRLHGDAGMWTAAAPVIKVSGSSQKKRQGGVLVADWPLMDRNQRVPAMWSGPLKFTAEVTQPGKVTTPPPPVTLEVEVKPALESLTHEVRDKVLWLVGQGRFIPTNADFRITCQKLDAATGQWVEDSLLDSAVRYKTQGDPQHGRCTDAGLFEASIPKLSLKKAGGGPFRFTWRRRVDRTGAALPVLGAVLPEPSTPEITSAELGL